MRAIKRHSSSANQTEPFLDWLGIRQPEISKTFNDWRFLCRYGCLKSPAASDYGRFKSETPLLAILALRKQGHGLRQIEKKLKVDPAVSSVICKDFQVYPDTLIPVSNQPKSETVLAKRNHWGIDDLEELIRQDAWHNRIWSNKRACFTKDQLLDEQRKKAAENAKRKYYQFRHLPAWKIKAAARQQLMRIARQVRLFQKSRRTIEYLGCTYQEAARHIESQFELGMSWANYGTYWEIDHIVPIWTIDLFDSKQLTKVCHFTNLRPLPIAENRSRPKPGRGWKQLRTKH